MGYYFLFHFSWLDLFILMVLWFKNANLLSQTFTLITSHIHILDKSLISCSEVAKCQQIWFFSINVKNVSSNRIRNLDLSFEKLPSKYYSSLLLPRLPHNDSTTGKLGCVLVKLPAVILWKAMTNVFESRVILVLELFVHLPESESDTAQLFHWFLCINITLCSLLSIYQFIW